MRVCPDLHQWRLDALDFFHHVWLQGYFSKKKLVLAHLYLKSLDRLVFVPAPAAVG